MTFCCDSWNTYTGVPISIIVSHDLKLRRPACAHISASLPFDFLTISYIFHLIVSPQMDRRYINLGNKVFLLINIPLCVLSLTANIFYVYCLIFNRGKIKQPLKMLLGCLVWCSVTFLIHLIFLHSVIHELKTLSSVYHLSWLLMDFIKHSSMTCLVWLSFCYYIQIVPSRRALFIWVKRNIKSFIYLVLLFDELVILFSSAVNTTNAVHIFWGVTAYNGTQNELFYDEIETISLVSFSIVKLHMLCCLGVMIVSNFSMVHYLHRHIKSVAQGNFVTPGIRGQKRVIIAALFQGALFWSYCTFYFIDSFSYRFSKYFYIDSSISVTCTSLYISGTTVSLALGQIIFRQKAADAWRALTALCSVGVATKDVKMCTSC